MRGKVENAKGTHEKRTTVRFRPELYDLLCELMLERKKSINFLINEAVELAFARELTAK